MIFILGFLSDIYHFEYVFFFISFSAIIDYDKCVFFSTYIRKTHFFQRSSVTRPDVTTMIIRNTSFKCTIIDSNTKYNRCFLNFNFYTKIIKYVFVYLRTGTE